MNEETVVNLKDPAFISACAAVVSAICALLTYLFSRRPSRREMVDILKLEILRVIFDPESREGWLTNVHNSTVYDDGFGPRSETLASLLPRKYRRKNWVYFMSPALEELKKEGYGELLGLSEYEKTQFPK